MAGIGFRLQKILSTNSYKNLLEGYGFAAIVSAGPILFTIFSVAILSVISLENLPIQDVTVFRTLVVYIYGASLITSSPAQMVITRYMSDRIFMDDFRAIVPAFVGILIISIAIHAAIGYFAIRFLEFDMVTSITAVVLFINVGIIWIAMIVLSAAKEFLWIVKSFFIGSAISVLGGYFMGRYYGLPGITAGFTIGQVTLVILLVVQIFTEFSYRNRIEFFFLKYFKKYAALAFIATFYNIGIWADKVVFWFYSDKTYQEVHGFLHASAVYDTPVFLAYLFIIPSLAMFTIKIETSFYMHYRKYFLSILRKHPFSSLLERKKNILNDLKLSLGRMIVMQGTITVIGLVMAPKIYSYLGMSAMNLGVFHIVILATFLQSLLQTLLIMILYFDMRTDALITAATFAFSNIIFSMWSINAGFSYYGYGYFGSCLLALMVGFGLFNYKMNNLLYYTFVGQKIIVHKEAV